MNDHVEQLINDVLRREGGFVNHPDDPGGATNFGITRATLSAYRREHVSVEDVRAMTQNEARVIYRQLYYLEPRIDWLPAAIQPFVFDSAVNHGPMQAVRFLQQACNQFPGEILQVDGKIGERTSARAAAVLAERGTEAFMRTLVDRRRKFYENLIARRPNMGVFYKGWMVRLAEFEIPELPPTKKTKEPSKLVAFLNAIRDFLLLFRT